MASVTTHKIARLGNEEVVLCRIENNFGAYIEVLNFGATLRAVVIPDEMGVMQDMILKYADAGSYFTDNYYIGATIGRVANRISDAKFHIGNKTYNLDKNDGKNTNHGGFAGLNKKVFNYEISEDKVVFSAVSGDGEGGFPGNLEIQVVYSFSDKHEVTIDFEVHSDAFTPVNLTNHAYFNLSPKGNLDATNHLLKVFSMERLEFDKYFLPTGKIVPVEASESHNFRNFETIQKNMRSKGETNIRGFNTYFIAEDKNGKKLKLLAELKDELSTVLLQVRSTMPGVQFYTGDYLDGEFAPFAGICLEAQYYPDNINHNNFPTSFVEKGKTWKETITYTFVHLSKHERNL